MWGFLLYKNKERKILNLLELRRNGRKKLIENNIEDAIIKADILIQFVLNMDKMQLIINQEDEVSKENENIYLTYIEQVISGKPVQYITNEQEFMNLKFYVDENVLIPQPDTEILVEEAIKTIAEIRPEKNIKVLDLCTGSGAIAIAIKKYAEDAKKQIEVYASDISEKAIKIAEKNAKRNNVHINFILSDMFRKMEEKNFDIILSNPPYIETQTISSLSKEVQYEPHMALDGGEDGLEFYRVIAENAHEYLNENGSILLEIGYNQKKKVMQIFEVAKKYSNIRCIKDLSDNDRVIKIDIN